MATSFVPKRTACVIGGTSYVASMLIKLLIEKGYAVNTTVRNPDDKQRTSHLTALQEIGDIKIFKAEFTDEESYVAPVSGCDYVFHVATPTNFASQDPENELIKPATEGIKNVLKACVKAKTVKRVIFTSSAAAVAVNNLKGVGLATDEKSWTDVEYLTSEKPPTWGFAVSKTLAEKTAWKFAEENNVDLVTIIPGVVAGPSIKPEVPSSVNLAAALISGNEHRIRALKGMQMQSGGITLVHVEDVCRAHLFLAEKESASGRYICCLVNTTVPELAKFLSTRYPQYEIQTDFGDFPTKAKIILSSEKLLNEGFSFKYGIDETYDQIVDYLKEKGSLH